MSTKPVLLEGSMKKLKSMKKKYFVLFGDSETGTEKAHLRYYDTEKKYRQAINKREPVNTKRCIILSDCFNINRKCDTRHPNVLALYTKDECFAIVFEHEADLQQWLFAMLRVHRHCGDDPPKPLFEHIWEVVVQKRGLGETRQLWGPTRVAINDRTLCLMRIGVNNWTGNADDLQHETTDITLASIRRYGASNRLFYLEVGRVSKTGAGEFWMDTEDALIAQHMHETLGRMTRLLKPPDDSTSSSYRLRSQSVNDTSKSNFLNKTALLVKYNQTTNTETPNENVSSRERCDSLPSYNAANIINSCNTAKTNLMNRPNSLYTRSPTSSSPMSPISLSRSDDDSSFSVDEVDSVPQDDTNRSTVKNINSSHSKMTILEENSEDFSISDKEIAEMMDQSLKISETVAERGYLVMLPKSETAKRNEIRSRTSSFVDDIPANNTSRALDNLSSSASSITSGTPSTDARFSAFHLEKIYAYFGEEEEESRPARTYSVGSKPEYAKSQQRGNVGGVEKGPLESLRNSRTRAFSLGSKARHPTSAAIAERNEKKVRKTASTEKSTSFPTLSRGSSEVVNDDNLMELDFSNNRNRRPTIISNSSKSTNPLQSPRSPTVSDYMEMSTPSTWKSESSTTMTNQLELEKNAKNSLTLSANSKESAYMEMGGSFESSRTTSQPIAITAKKTSHCGAGDDFTQHQQNSVDNGQHMIFSLSLENKTDDALKLMEQNLNTDVTSVTTPPTEPLVSPMTPTITTAANPETTPLDADSEIFQTTDIASSGEYTMIAPPKYRSNIQHNYVELDFPDETTCVQSASFRKGCINTPKPLYAQLRFPTATTATAPAAINAATTTKSSKNNKNNKKK